MVLNGEYGKPNLWQISRHICLGATFTWERIEEQNNFGRPAWASFFAAGAKSTGTLPNVNSVNTPRGPDDLPELRCRAVLVDGFCSGQLPDGRPRLPNQVPSRWPVIRPEYQ
jgi:hypothetical protein